MMLPIRKNFFTPAVLALAAAGVLGTTQKVALDRTWPAEELVLFVDVTCGATGPTLIGPDAPLNIVKHINLSVNDGVQPRTIVDYSGIGLLEYASCAGLNLDAATQGAIGHSYQTAIANNQKFRIAYRVPLVHPMLTEPLRTRCLQPFHLYPQDPILTIDFESSANLCSAGSFSAVVAHYQLIRRIMPQSLSDAIQKNGGFIPMDLLETPLVIGTGIAGEQRWSIPTPGSYLNLLFRQYLGGASVTRAELDQSTTFGSESRWRLESGGVVQREWRWHQEQRNNDWSRPLNGNPSSLVLSSLFAAATSAGSPTTQLAAQFLSSPVIGGLPASGTSYRPASSVMLDFLTDGLDSANELGSVLDCNIPANTGLKMELIGPVASVATNASTLYIGGHRLFGDLSKYQAAAA